MGSSLLETRLRERLAEEGLAPTSVNAVVADAARFSDYFAGSNGEPLDPEDLQITTLDLTEWKGYLQRHGAKPATLHRKFSSLRKVVLTLAPGLMADLRWPRLPRVTNLSPSGFTRNELNALVRGAAQLSSRDNALIHLALWTGARVASLAAVKLSNAEINGRSGSVRFDVAKGGHEYSVPLNSMARAALAKWIAERPVTDHDYLFCSERWPYRPLSPWAIHNAYHRRLARHVPEELARKLKGVHQCRHNLARTALEQGTPLPEIAALLNHRSLATTANYLRPCQRDLQNAVDRLIGEGEDE